MTHTGGASQKRDGSGASGSKRPVCRIYAHGVRRVAHRPPPGPTSLCSEENDCDLLVTKWMTRKKVGKFDLKTETSHRWALVVIPLGGDGGIGHAITIVGDLIFDSTQSHALKLGKKSLDWCCANDRGFESIYMAIKFAWKKHQTFNI
jgi:hypothetical protein